MNGGKKGMKKKKRGICNEEPENGKGRERKKKCERGERRRMKGKIITNGVNKVNKEHKQRNMRGKSPSGLTIERNGGKEVRGNEGKRRRETTGVRKGKNEGGKLSI